MENKVLFIKSVLIAHMKANVSSKLLYVPQLSDLIPMAV